MSMKMKKVYVRDGGGGLVLVEWADASEPEEEGTG